MDMKSIEVSGKTVDEAIFKGLQQLEISIDEVEIQIIKQETKGILGFGAKPAIVRLVQKAAEEVEVPDFPCCPAGTSAAGAIAGLLSAGMSQEGRNLRGQSRIRAARAPTRLYRPDNLIQRLPSRLWRTRRILRANRT